MFYTLSMTNGTKPTIMSSKISKRLSQICKFFITILNKSEPQFIPPI